MRWNLPSPIRLTLLKALRRVLTGIGALYLIVTLTPIDRWWTNLLTGPTYDPKGDILIVLSGDALPDALAHGSYLRALYAVRYWRDGGYRQIFVSGGPSPGGPPIATQMRDFMVAQGVPAAAITVETASSTTRENALFTLQALRGVEGRKVLLTSDYHSFRAFRAFRKAGLDVASSSLPDNYKRIDNWWSRWDVFVGLCRETIKIVYYFVRGWI
jgi:uncharacterized SAM-binding protein YcdF (DUF218 family)